MANKLPPGVDLEGTISSAIVDGLVLFAVEKIWISCQIRQGTNDRNGGFNLVPPAGMEIVVAFMVKEQVTTQLQHTISEDKFFAFLRTLIDKNTANLTASLDSF